MKNQLILGTCLAVMALPSAHARPVSYPDGWTVMQNNNGDRSSLHVHYSPTAWHSVGYRGEVWHSNPDGADFQFHGVQVNKLMKRWNKRKSQANVYLKGAAGVAIEGDETGAAAFAGLAADWETQRWFTSYENRLTWADGLVDTYQQSGRLGIAPYIGEYGDLHTWLMLEVEHTPEAKDPIQTTALVRLFKGDWLGEAGVRNDGRFMLNLIKRF